MSMTVDQLDSYDQSNLEVIRIEFVKLQRKLEKCRDEQEDFSNAAIGNVDIIQSHFDLCKIYGQVVLIFDRRYVHPGVSSNLYQLHTSNF